MEPENERLEDYISLGLQVPPQKVFGPSKPTTNTFLEGIWSPLQPQPGGLQVRC